MAEDEITYRQAKSKRTQAKAVCTRGKTFVDELGDRRISVVELRQRQAKFRESWKVFDKAQSRIELFEADEGQEAVHNNERQVFEDRYFEIDTKFEELIIAATAPENTLGPNPFGALTPQNTQDNGQPPNINVRLPRIDLPSFAGSYEDWRPFRDVFISIIHQSTVLSTIQKMQYLKAALKGEAADVISSLELSADNYVEAWDMLNERYDNQRVIVQKHIKAIFDLPVLVREGHAELRQLLDTSLKHLRALKVLKRSTDKWDDLLVHIVTSKLAPATNKEWETSLKSADVPTFKELIDFLSQRCRALEAIDRKPQLNASSNKPEKNASKKYTAAHAVTDKTACSFCKGDHPIYCCSKFQALSIDKRIAEIRQRKICLNCLKSTDHRAGNCNAGSCKKCHKRHNTLLHLESDKQAESSVPKSTESNTHEQAQDQVARSVNHATRAAGHQFLLSTAVVHIQDIKGNPYPCRALLDCGSQSNFITMELVEKLKLKQVPSCVPIHGVGNSNAATHGLVKVIMRSRLNGFKAELNCFVLRQITQELPTTTIKNADIHIPTGIKLADPEFMESAKIDLLLGVEVFWNLICVGQIKATDTQPCWQKTQLGWIAAGKFLTRQCSNLTLCNLTANEELNHAMRRFWEIEQGARNDQLTLEERNCEEHFAKNYIRNSEGRFIVKLPVKTEEMSQLGQSRDIAVHRFKGLERRFKRQPSLKGDYVEFMREYATLGHMKELRGEQSTAALHYYIPHHCVIKEENSTTKLRVVFDASCKTSSGISLNDALMIGPVLQQDLISIILRFRTFKYALIADIEKMYRQVLVDETQLPLQRIVWREDPDEPLKEFELLTLTYGTGPASFLAIKALRTLATLERENYPVGSRITLRDFYVDDLITGANSRTEALQILNETTKLLHQGGFVLKKWASNERDLLINVSNLSHAATRALDREGVCRTLGIRWNPVDDVFQYNITVRENHEQRATKRKVLSFIARIFDPLGLLGPVVVIAKLLIQTLWTLHLDWDESLPVNVHTEWKAYLSQIKQLNNFCIPRNAMEIHPIVRIELHGFCDASQNAYGACLYIRVTDQDGIHYTNLLCSKSRVAPLKTVNLPRLELCGAQLLSQLVHKTIQVLDLQLHEIYYWTDSTIVIGWIKSPSRNFSTFVANRIGEIQELTTIENWRHVRTKDNPADPLSRGFNAEALKKSEIWWKGPPWLRQDQCCWPKPNQQVINLDELPERRRMIITNTTARDDFDVYETFSSYARLVRAIAICFRFVHNSRSDPQQRRFGAVTAQEFEAARKRIVKQVQQVAFQDIVKDIKGKETNTKNHRLLNLNPFIDSEGLLRVGGRLKRSDLSYDSKHQLILPTRHRFTQLVIEHEHKRTLHSGSQCTLAAVRLQYWPVGARSMVRKIVNKCVICFKAKPRVSKQIMADLPSTRVNKSRPFSNVGIDYCGPILLREGKRRNAKSSKAWIAIFVCFATKAIHIELVTDLTSEAFLSALKRFIGRRGRPSNIFSDNGTNFVGANRALEELRDLFNQEEFRHRVTNEAASDAITWHFIPPRAPHFGGLWEAAVRSTKHHFYRVASDGSLTFEEAATLLIQIEAILNSRPITPLSSDPDDSSYLTPGHFLIGDSLIAYPEPDLQHLPNNRLSRWQYIEKIRQQFWKRWSVEYLHQMQQRNKWKRDEGPPIQVGQLVVVKEDGLPPQSWLVGRIMEVHPGADNVVRAASVKTTRGTFKRPASKLCVLPLET
ncbi:uncharacterized protein [Linepithema humile]|uniref:uncharacterized protein n=1 Tax=Linepithema humile TaxID=83485 RepID=UPI00351F589C